MAQRGGRELEANSHRRGADRGGQTNRYRTHDRFPVACRTRRRRTTANARSRPTHPVPVEHRTGTPRRASARGFVDEGNLEAARSFAVDDQPGAATHMRRHDRGKYDAVLAHARSREKARRDRGGRIGKDLVLRDLVQEKLTQDWSPEQISFWLRETHPQKKSWHVCHETIYQAVYWPRNSGLTRKLTTHLRTGRPLRKRRRRPDVRTPRFIAPATLIDHRPAVVEEHSRLGDWEGDLIIGTKTRSGIGTLVDRKSGYVLLLHLPSTHTAVEVNVALTATMSQLPPHLRHTLTWDQGSEMANHDKIASLFDDGVFFAHPGKPWQRGSNENMNGLLRQYFPKHSDLSIHNADALKAIAAKLNDRPRKRLNWISPAQLFTAGPRSHQETSVATTA